MHGHRVLTCQSGPGDTVVQEPRSAPLPPNPSKACYAAVRNPRTLSKMADPLSVASDLVGITPAICLVVDSLNGVSERANDAHNDITVSL